MFNRLAMLLGCVAGACIGSPDAFGQTGRDSALTSLRAAAAAGNVDAELTLAGLLDQDCACCQRRDRLAPRRLRLDGRPARLAAHRARHPRARGRRRTGVAGRAAPGSPVENDPPTAGAFRFRDGSRRVARYDDRRNARLPAAPGEPGDSGPPQGIARSRPPRCWVCGAHTTTTIAST